jgi:hypothetical protein
VTNYTDFLILQEYHVLKFEHLSTGRYANQDNVFSGLPYLQVGGQLQQKARVLSVSNDTFLTDRDARRVVHNPNDPLSPFLLFSRLRKITHPDQEYIFCHELSSATRVLLTTFDERFEGITIDPRRHMGEKTISNFCKVLNKRIGMKEWEKYTNHCWRSWMVTRLANNAAVSSQESLSFARHNNATSQLPYVRRGENSSYNFQKAIQTVKYPNARSLKRVPNVAGKRKKNPKAPPPTKSNQSVCVSTRAGSRNNNDSSRMATRSVTKK